MTHRLTSVVFALTFVFGCSGERGPVTNENDPPLLEDGDSDLSEAPPPAPALSQVAVPDVFLDLVPLQTPVKDQGSRSTCTAFASAALMEAYYLKHAVNTVPDFSEQFLYWETKAVTGFWPHQALSKVGPTLDTIHRLGIVSEDDWRYEDRYWSPAKNRACSGKALAGEPTPCFTNGDPPAAALAAKRSFLPSSPSIHVADLKAHLYRDRLPIAVGAKVFHQAWNLERSPLPVNIDYFHHGYVLYPTKADMQQKTGGHAFLIVGWDDTLEVPILDEKGRPVSNPDGSPAKEKGFFVFKNSWGTKSFGALNPVAAGYGYLSERYVADFLPVCHILPAASSPAADGGGVSDGGANDGGL